MTWTQKTNIWDSVWSAIISAFRRTLMHTKLSQLWLRKLSKTREVFIPMIFQGKPIIILLSSSSQRFFLLTNYTCRSRTILYLKKTNEILKCMLIFFCQQKFAYFLLQTRKHILYNWWHWSHSFGKRNWTIFGSCDLKLDHIEDHCYMYWSCNYWTSHPDTYIRSIFLQKMFIILVCMYTCMCMYNYVWMAVCCMCSWMHTCRVHMYTSFKIY